MLPHLHNLRLTLPGNVCRVSESGVRFRVCFNAALMENNTRLKASDHVTAQYVTAAPINATPPETTATLDAYLRAACKDW